MERGRGKIERDKIRHKQSRAENTRQDTKSKGQKRGEIHLTAFLFCNQRSMPTLRLIRETSVNKQRQRRVTDRTDVSLNM